MDEALLAKIGEVERDHWWFVVRRAIVLQVLDALELPDDARIVEVGCGTGGTLAELQERHSEWRCLGVEPSDGACRVAREKGCEVVRAALPALPLPDASADCVLALDVLEHCKDDARAAAEMARVLAQGGHLVLTVPALPSLWSLHDVDNAHFRRYTRRTLVSALEGADLAIERLTYFNTLLLPLGYASRWASRLTRSRKTLGVEIPARPVNDVLQTLFSLETKVLRHGDLPIGMSLLAIARKEPGCSG